MYDMVCDFFSRNMRLNNTGQLRMQHKKQRKSSFLCLPFLPHPVLSSLIRTASRFSVHGQDSRDGRSDSARASSSAQARSSGVSGNSSGAV
jgi:hypothetical protein